MNRCGDSPLGMVERRWNSPRICRRHDFHNFVFSMKSSNPKVMIECYRLLAARLEEEDLTGTIPAPWRHRGGRRGGRKNQVCHRHRIPALRRDRGHHSVSLTEDSPARLPSAMTSRTDSRLVTSPSAISQDAKPTEYPSDPFTMSAGPLPKPIWAECALGNRPSRVVVTQATFDAVAPRIQAKADVRPEAIYEDLNLLG